MIEHLLDNNVISQILKGNQTVTNFVVGLDFAICAVVYIEALGGLISNAQKRTIKKLSSRAELSQIIGKRSRVPALAGSSPRKKPTKVGTQNAAFDF